MKSAKSFIAVAIVAAVALTGCGNPTPSEPDDGIDTGVVVERSRRVVVVLEDDGERERHSVSKRNRKCPVGSRWPDCNK